MLQERNLEEALTLSGSHYWPVGGTELTLTPKNDSGVTINGVTVSPKSLVSETKLGARYLVVVDDYGRAVAKVVEHLLSAVHGAGLKGVNIDSPLWVPVIGPGIDGIYKKIVGSSSLVDNIMTPTVISGERLIQTDDGLGTLAVSPSEKLHLVIERKEDPEIGVDSMIEFPDLYDVIQNSAKARMARPIARVRNPLVNGIQKGIECLGGKGVSRDNYVFNRPGFSREDITRQMLGEFQDNEHLAHTGTADFFGELHTHFPQGLRAKLHFSGKNTHPIRLELLKKLVLAHLYG